MSDLVTQDCQVYDRNGRPMFKAWDALLETVNQIRTTGMANLRWTDDLISPKIPVEGAKVGLGLNPKTINYQFFSASPDAAWETVLPTSGEQKITEQEFRACNGNLQAIAALGRKYSSGLCGLPSHTLSMGADSYTRQAYAVQFEAPRQCAYDLYEKRDLRAVLEALIRQMPMAMQDATEAQLLRLVIANSYRNFAFAGQKVVSDAFGIGKFNYLPTSGPDLETFMALAEAASLDGASRLVVEMSLVSIYKMVKDHAAKLGINLWQGNFWNISEFAAKKEWSYGNITFRAVNMPIVQTAANQGDVTELQRLFQRKARLGTESGVMLDPDFASMQSCFDCEGNQNVYETAVLIAEGVKLADNRTTKPFTIEQFGMYEKPPIEGLDLRLINSYKPSQVRVFAGNDLECNKWKTDFAFGMQSAFLFRINEPRLAYNLMWRKPAWEPSIMEIACRTANCVPSSITVTPGPGIAPMGPPTPDTPPEPPVGCLKIRQAKFTVVPKGAGGEDTVIHIQVCREGGTAGAITADYDLGATGTTAVYGTDYSVGGGVSGSLSWADEEGGCKEIVVTVDKDSTGGGGSAPGYLVIAGLIDNLSAEAEWCEGRNGNIKICIVPPVECPDDDDCNDPNSGVQCCQPATS